MDNSIIGEFAALSPSQKRELEKQRKEKEERESAAAKRKSDAARKAREAAKMAKAARDAELARLAKEKELKKNGLTFFIVVLCLLIGIVIWLWIHFFNVSYRDWIGGADGGDKIVYGVFYFLFTSIIVGPIIAGIVAGIERIKNEIKKLK